MMSAQHPLWPLYCWLRPRKVAYEQLKNSDFGKIILADLERVCRAHAPTRNDRDAGMRDVWLHIERMCDLSDEEYAIIHEPLTPEQRHQLYKPGKTYFNDDN